MGKFRFFRWFNKNQKVLILGIIAIVFIILILQVLNSFAKKDKDNKKEVQSNTQNNLSKSVISDDKLIEPLYNNNKKIIEEFTEYCNSGNIESAYDLITKDCKEVLFGNIEKFKSNYYESIFNKNRKCVVQYWDDGIYEVKYSEDSLSTGKSRLSNSITDYIKIYNENGKSKLSINGFLGKKKIDKKKTIKNVTINILNRYSYMDYETYDIEIKNNSGETLILDNLNEIGTMYLLDKKNTKHYSINSEIVKDNLIVQDAHESIASIKFDNPYIKDRKIEKIVFSNVGIGHDERYGSKPYINILNFEIEL